MSIGSGFYQTSGEEKDVIKENLKRTRKLLETKTTLLKSHRSDKHLCCVPYKILATIYQLTLVKT